MRVRTFIVSLFVISLLGLVGCTKTTEFKGESATWSVTCSVNQSGTVKSYQIRYLGQEKGPENSQISFSFMDSKNFQASKESSATSLKGLKINGKFSTDTPDTPYVNEDHFKLHIKWNDQEETIQVEQMS
ncbi:hypothetical protein [Paenibacillus eucommiae]|uniref:Lipoprotein n=1 Tax=Paenibacillus eucommiae TaxID=1355755 RepID=A0ABS4IMQ3_9BACL|nr:hypothetical protein [Paenibacillus eucommiae]MBP1988852.1 hypothetical protein [Paenibacillus eucommiae]